MEWKTPARIEHITHFAPFTGNGVVCMCVLYVRAGKFYAVKSNQITKFGLILIVFDLIPEAAADVFFHLSSHDCSRKNCYH